LHALATKDRGIKLEDRRQSYAPVQDFVIETEDPASDVVCAQNSLIIVDREQNRYITIPAGSGCNIPRVPEILTEYTLLDTPGRCFCDTHDQGEGLLCGLRVHR
jgi:hypothetical protein